MIALILAAVLSVSAYARQISLTFDDCPRKTGVLMRGMERAEKLVAGLKKSGVRQVGFFCNSPAGEDEGEKRIRYLADQGHIIANHSASHFDLNRTPGEDFARDIDRAHEELKGFSNFRQWFRFPYLREGESPQKIRFIRDHLRSRGYMNGYVTVDTQDWYMDDILGRGAAAGRKYNESRLCGAYRRMMTDEADFYDNMSVKALGRSVKHVLLLHETDLNAICISELVRGLRDKGWEIISPDEAYTDPIAAVEPSVNVPLNQGRVHALAKERGYKGPYFSFWTSLKNIEDEFDRVGVWE